MNDDQHSEPATAPSDADGGIERREILVRLGKLAALTPPAVVTMLVTARSAAASP